MQLAGNAGQALGNSREGVESVIDWLAANREALPVGLAVAAAIVAAMLALRWVGGRLVLGDPHCSHWRGVIGRVLHKTSIFFMVAAALDIVATYAAVPPRLERLIDIGKVSELRGIRGGAGGGLSLGALTTYRDLLDSAEVRSQFPVLIEVVDGIGDVQVRNRGTVGGAVAHRLRQPLILGYILAGVVIGPFTPGVMGETPAIAALAEVGIIFLMFVVGVQLPLKELLQTSKVAVVGGLAQVAVMIGIGYGVGRALGWSHAAAYAFGAVLGLAVVLEFGSTTRGAVLAALVVLNAASEFVSFSRVIDAVPPLRAFDRAGRRRE